MMKGPTSYTDQDIEKMQDDILALKMAVNALLVLLANDNKRNLSELLKSIGFEANRIEREYPELSGTTETLDIFLEQLKRIYLESKNINE
ncbi:TPA: hypothetical protein LVN23_002965 [Klebsiella oxytoca]|nr:hypothetical protein CWN68_09935 [Klebsiella michiganensis]HBM3248977.1 hypothetical protein [Klebsiella oxytoca]